METPDLAESIRGRLAEIHEEEHRLRTALGILEASPTATARSPRRIRAKAPAKANGANGTRDKVLSAVMAAKGPLTASGVARATGLHRSRVSTMLAKLAKDGQLTKAARGYTL